jgi:TolB-like protein
MRRRFRGLGDPLPKLTSWIVALAVAAPLASARAAPPRKPRVAVLDIRALGTEAHKADLVSEVALTEAASFRELEVIGRSDIIAMIGFQKQKEMLGCSEDSACVAEIGGALGVDFILLGSLGKMGDLLRLDLKLVEARKARVLARYGDSVAGREDAMLASVQRGVRMLLTPVARPGAPVALAPAEAAPAEGARQEKKAMSRRRIAAWAFGGAGLACVAGGATFGLLAQQAYDDQKAATDPVKYDEYKALADDRALYADVLYGLGAAGIVTGAWLYFTGNDPPAVSAGVVPFGDGALAVVAGSF